jgi:hypothetical protein
MGPFHVREKGCGIVQIDARKNALTGNGCQFDGVSWGLGGSARQDLAERIFNDCG